MATIDCDPKFGTDRLASAVLEFPGGPLTFTVGTQLSAHQRMTFSGRRAHGGGDPLQCPARQDNRIRIDNGGDIGGECRGRGIQPCDQYTLQGDAFSRAILDEPPPGPDRGLAGEYDGDRCRLPFGGEREVGEALGAGREVCPSGFAAK